MPVLHYYPVIGGLENWTQNIAERLSEKTEIFVVTGEVRGEPKEEIKNGVKIFRASLFSLKNLSYSSPFYIFSALPFIFLKALLIAKKEKIDLFHCQGFLSAFLGYFLSKIAKIPYIVTVQRIEENKSFLRKLVYRNARVCIAASSAIKEYFQGIGCQDIEVIPNGIDLGRFGNLIRKSHEGFVVITVARLEKVKGINYLIEAILNLKFQIPNPICLIIGDGSERKNLWGLVERLGLKDMVKFLGQIPNEKIPEYLVRADCFVLSSLKEGFGIAILEAMAAGLPIISTSVGGIKDIIEDGKTGILVNPRDSQKIADAILKIYTQPQISRYYVNNAMAKLRQYDWGNIAQRVYEIYQKITI